MNPFIQFEHILHSGGSASDHKVSAAMLCEVVIWEVVEGTMRQVLAQIFEFNFDFFPKGLSVMTS